MITPGSILLFDGVCKLCNGLVKFIVRKDRKRKICFAHLQSAAGKSLLKKYDPDSDNMDTVVYISEEKHFLKSAAVLHLLKDIGYGWQLFYCLIIIPEFIRDFFYDLIARNRYRIFGKSDACMAPAEDIKERFMV